MKMDRKSRKVWWNFFIITAFFLLFLFGFSWYTILAQNNAKYKITDSNDGNIGVRMSYGSLGSEKWETTIQLTSNPNSKDIFTGETSSCFIVNNTKNDIKNWTLKINIVDDCYLNGFWCGSFEVHQFRNGKEIVEVVNSSKLDDPSQLQLDCNPYSSNAMINLLPGDYLIYIPSKEANEDIVKAHNSVGIGFIFYYQSSVDLSNFEFNYHKNLQLKNTVLFKIVLILFIIWFVGLFLSHMLLFMNKKIASDMDNSIRNISIMAELYLEVHMINLDTNTGYLIKGDKKNLLFNFFGCKVDDYFKKYIEQDCKEEYRKDLTRFLDLSAIKEIIGDISSLSFEYQSIKQGWCEIRLIAVDNNEKNPQAIFTVQDINEEKIKQEQDLELIQQNEFAQLVRGNFLKTVSFSTNALLGDIIQTNNSLSNILKNKEQKNLSSRVDCSIEHLSLLQNCVYDMFALESLNFRLNPEEYNIYEMVERLEVMFKPFYENKNFEFQKSIDEGIPETLEGDKKRIMQVLMLILISAFMVTQQGFVKFSIFAKKNGDFEELLFSVRDTAEGFTEEQMKEIQSFIKGVRTGSFDNPALVYLRIINGILQKMGSELKMVSSHGTGSEFYFSLYQKIVKKV